MLILIGSSGHSGSTLLDLMLGNHSQVSSAGEMNRLSLFADDRVCACGSTVSECEYWDRVLRQIAQAEGATDLHWSQCHTDVTPIEPYFSLPDGPDTVLAEGADVPNRLREALAAHKLPVSPSARLVHGGVRDAKWRLLDDGTGVKLVLRRERGQLVVYPAAPRWRGPLRKLPNLLELAVALGAQQSVLRLEAVSKSTRGLIATARNSWRVAEAMAAVDRTRYVVDSSKTAIRLKLMYLLRPERVRVLYLVRDGRAVSASAMRRQGVSASVAARSWRRENQHLKMVLRGIPATQCHRIRYEDLCEDPARELRRVCDFLGLAFEEPMPRLWERAVHNIPGNPMLFQKARRDITRDERWRRELTADQAAIVERITSPLNRSFGYPPL
jgi:hypothetical protein